MRSKTKIGSLVTALVFISSLLCRSVARASDHQSFVREIEDALPGYMARYNVPGVSIALIEGGEIVYVESFGFADRAKQTPVTSNTAYQVASVSKCLTAWGVMNLVDDGLIGLDDPVENYLTRWHIPPSQYNVRGVTVRRLLKHTAGISLSGYGEGVPVNEPLPTVEESLSGDTRGCGAVELVREPGQSMIYSGGGYTILQLMVEEVTGQTFAAYMEESVLRPLGMENSTFAWDEKVQSRLSRAYGTYYNTIPNYRYIEDAAGGLYSTITDMAHYAQAVLNDSDVLSEESFNLMFEGESYGLGHGLADFPAGQHFIFGGGTRMGWQSDFSLYPENDSGIVVLSNANGGIVMNLEIINHWTKWKTGVSWPGAGLFLYQYPVLLAIAIALGVVCAIYTIVLRRQFGRGKRVFLFSGLAHRRVLRAGWTCVLLAMVVLWWLVGFSDVFDPQAKMLWLPEPFLYTSVLGTYLALLMVVSALFPKVRLPKLDLRALID